MEDVALSIYLSTALLITFLWYYTEEFEDED